jgi:hypothetical protein
MFEDVDWICLTQNRFQWWAVMNIYLYHKIFMPYAGICLRLGPDYICILPSSSFIIIVLSFSATYLCNWDVVYHKQTYSISAFCLFPVHYPLVVVVVVFHTFYNKILLCLFFLNAVFCCEVICFFSITCILYVFLPVLTFSFCHRWNPFGKTEESFRCWLLPDSKTSRS